MHIHRSFPATRLRRLRQSAPIRDLLQEHRIHAADLVWPVFVTEGTGLETPIPSMPGVSRYSLDLLPREVAHAAQLGIKAVALFPVIPPEKKDSTGSEALRSDTLLCRALQLLKQEIPDIALIADVALDPYTQHGHDGVLHPAGDDVANDPTLTLLAQQAVLLAQAGADIVAPSDMMDGRIQAIRSALDAQSLTHTLILSYAAKYASAFYGPFREAVGSADALKTSKKSYQMAPANSDEAMAEIALDITEGADMIMVKPGLPYLDIIHRARQNFPEIPISAYQVSGEYAMMRSAAGISTLDYRSILMESLLAFKRAGCRYILTHGARDAASLLKETDAMV